MLGAEVEADRAGPGHFHEGAGEQVLAVVLLAVVPAPLPVDPAPHAVGGEGRVKDVEHVLAALQDGHDRDVLDHPRVPGLATALRVEGRAVEHDRGPALVLPAANHPGLELEQVGVVAVEALGHARRAGITGGPSGRPGGYLLRHKQHHRADAPSAMARATRPSPNTL